MSRYIASRENMAGGLATIFIKLRLLSAQVKGIYTGQLIYETTETCYLIKKMRSFLPGTE